MTDRSGLTICRRHKGGSWYHLPSYAWVAYCGFKTIPIHRVFVLGIRFARRAP